MATNDFEESDSQEIENAETVDVDAPVASQFASLAASYLRDWNSMLSDSCGTINVSASTIEGILSDSGASNELVDQALDTAVSEINAGISDYNETYGRPESEAMGMAMAEFGASKDTVAQTHDKAQPAYAPQGQSDQRIRSVDDARIYGRRSAQQGFGSKHRLAPLTRPTRPASLLKSLRPNGLSCLIRPPKSRP